tara:strand:+ start:47 stop:826 length:780 start_codon:yes stop_codon:yes gene_type:complete
MPNFNKSKGFQLRSGNKANAPFKMMGSSPAKNLGGLLGKIGSSKTDASGDLLFNKQKTPKAPETKTIDTTEGQKNTNKVKPANLKIKGTDKVSSTSSRPDSEGPVTKEPKPKSNKAKPKLSEAAKAAKKEKRAQAFRDAGEIISNVGDPNTSMSSVIQGQADRRTDKADKATARKDKDIQNKKDIANTKRTNQVIAEHTAKLNKDSSKLSADTPSTDPTGESSAEKIANQKAVKDGTLVKNSDGSYSPSSSADHQFIKE